MRIGIYHSRVGFAASGGTETFLREMMQRLSEDHQVVCYTGEGELLDEIAEMDITVEQIPLTTKEESWNKRLSTTTPILPSEVESLSMFLGARKRNIFDQMANQVDVLSTHYYLDNILVSRQAPVPTLFHFGGIKQPSIRWKAMTWFANPNCYLANSESTASRIRRWLGIDVDGIVYPGVDTDRFNPTACPRDIADNKTAVLYVGRLDEGKGLRELIDAHASLTDWQRLYLVGGGTLEEELRKRVQEKGIEESVTFVGRVPNEELPGYYTGADIFCLPSHHESFGIVNLEAMACGTPVVSTSIDAIEEYLSDGENGMTIPPGDTTALRNALRKLGNSPKLQERFSTAGRDTAQEYSWSRQAEKFEFYLSEVAESNTYSRER